MDDVRKMIRDAMEDAGVSAPELSERMGKSRNYMWSLLGKDSYIQMETLAAIGAALGYEVEVFLTTPESRSYHATVPAPDNDGGRVT